jgi:serine/threonine-protein kinase PpkA
MNPYIEECRKLIRAYYDKIEASGQGSTTFLALVAFRNSVKGRPEVEYVTRVISDFKAADDRDSFERALEQVREAPVPTHSFSEDSLAGLEEALNLDWQPYVGRQIILLTDAGPLDPSDPENSLVTDPEKVANRAKLNHITIVSIHLKTPNGAKNHAQAERAYRALSFDSSGRSGYLELKVDGQEGPRRFAGVTRNLMTALDDYLTDPKDPVKPPEADLEDKTAEERAADLGAILGYSVRLKYLGSKNGVRAPRVVRSWIPEKDLSSLDSDKPREVRTVDVALLMSKRQISVLSEQLKAVLEQAQRFYEKGGGSEGFFQSILEASAKMARDPDQFSLNPGQRLGQTGLMESLDGLPYKSAVMGLTEEDWHDMMPTAQDSFIRNLRSKLAGLEALDRDESMWEKGFNPKNSDEWLCRVPIRMLP